MKDETKKHLSLTILLILTILFSAHATILLHQTSNQENTPTGSATATVGICIGEAPYWLNPIECDEAFTGVPFTCDVSAMHDTSSVDEYEAEMISGNSNGSALFNNISSDGIMSFTPEYNMSGEYEILLYVRDSSSCSLQANTTFNITVTLANQSPIFNGPIPNSTWSQNTILVPYNLNSYFVDPQGWPLTYRAEGNTRIKTTISSSGEVTYQPENNWCGKEIVQFIATNPANLTAESNLITLEVECPEQPEEDTQQTTGSGGGGGGGGAGAPNACVENFYCYDWSSCQYTKAVSKVDGRTINITGVRGQQQYELEEPLREGGEEIFYQGYQWRECIDTRMCTDRRLVYARTCEYEPTCSDGIQNQGETGIDCGGPNCAPCHTCDDGIQNGLETGVDCGGPDCPPCEEVSRLPEEQEPAVVSSPLTMVLFGALLALLVVILGVIFARNYVIRLLAAYALKYQRSNRVVLLSSEEKQEVLAELAEFEEERASLDVLVAQQRIARVARGYYMRAFDLEFEFSSDELVEQLSTVQESLAELLVQFFSRVQEVEFSKKPVRESLVDTLVGEVEQLVYQTSVLSVEEMRLFEEPLELAEAEDGASWFDQMLVVLSNAQRAVASGRPILGRQLYAQAHSLYGELSASEQQAVHPELYRLFNALLVEEFKQHSLLHMRQRKR